MSTYTAFIYENHNLQEHKPEWMRAERYKLNIRPQGIYQNSYRSH